jgi:hypothetical protein
MTKTRIAAVLLLLCTVFNVAAASRGGRGFAGRPSEMAPQRSAIRQKPFYSGTRSRGGAPRPRQSRRLGETSVGPRAAIKQQPAIRQSTPEKQKTYQTYTKVNPSTGQVYTGRTSGTGTPAQNIARRDASHHMNAQGYGPARLDKSSTNRDAIRGREQQLIDKNGGAQSHGGTSGNRINGIGQKNPDHEHHMTEAEKAFAK